MAEQQPSKVEHISECNGEEQKHDNCKTDNPSGSSDLDSRSEHKSGGPSTTENAECPNGKCGDIIARNKKGQFPKCCPWCNEDLSSLLLESYPCTEKSNEKVKTADPGEKKITGPPLVVEVQPLTVYSECGFCCLKLIEIEEPRVLPCGHIQCTQCIELNIDNTVITCKVRECRKEFTDISIGILPKVAQEIINDVLVPISMRCDLCVGTLGSPTMAVRCCADCKKKLCVAHAEEHELHISNHELLLLEDGLAPERYEVQRCVEHENHVLNEICRHCMKLFCKRCETKALCTTLTPNKTYRSVHHTVPLREVTDELREKMKALSQQLYDKMKRCRNLEKKTWRKLSDLEDHIQRQTNTVDNIAEEMITKIKRLRDDIKSELQSYADNASAEVESYSEDMLIGITVLDDKYRYGQTLADRTPDNILLEEFTLAESELTQAAADIDIEKVLLMKRPYLDKGTPLVDICTKVITEPGKLDFIGNRETSNWCYGVSWTEDGSRVICAMSDGVEVRGDDRELIQKVDIADELQVLSAHLTANRLYTQLGSHTTKKYCTYVGSLAEPTQTLLHEVQFEDDGKLHHISVTHNRLAIINRVSKELRICTPDGTHMHDIELRDMESPYCVELFPADNSVLVTDSMVNQLRKYRLEHDAAEPAWTLSDLDWPAGITTDESGLIYVASLRDGVIRLISPQGERIKELTHPMLNEAVEKEDRIVDISVSDGRMVVACKGGGVMYFNMV